MTNGSVLVAKSGGVDSSVVACLLLEQGYDVMGSLTRSGSTWSMSGLSQTDGVTQLKYRVVR